MSDDYTDQHVFCGDVEPPMRDMSPYNLQAGRIRELEEQNTLLRSEMNKLEDENSKLTRRMSLMSEHSKLFEQCEVMRKAIDANIHRMREVEALIEQLGE